ncbi:hypothetical protein AB0O22_30590 [Streptomyces sp. NPDC091204]|uniref:hypothetical protein n=1 Tax=Streptomyces sp. NPDC091204 TaxID=3155299 RepID=UPI0034302AB7
MLKTRKIAVPFAAALLVLAGAHVASADTVDPAAEQAKEQADRAGTKKTGDIFATYKGKKINLTKNGWGTAKNCAEYPDLTVKCFDTEDEEKAATDSYKKAKKGTKHAIPEAPEGRSDLTMKKGAPNKSGSMAIAVDGDGTAYTPFGSTRIWADIWYYGRQLTFYSDGSKNLGDYSFRDQASSTCNNDETGGMSLYDWRTGMPDPSIITGLGGCLGNLHSYSYPYGGNWGDKADELTM